MPLRLFTGYQILVFLFFPIALSNCILIVVAKDDDYPLAVRAAMDKLRDFLGIDKHMLQVFSTEYA